MAARPPPAGEESLYVIHSRMTRGITERQLASLVDRVIERVNYLFDNDIPDYLQSTLDVFEEFEPIYNDEEVPDDEIDEFRQDLNDIIDLIRINNPSNAELLGGSYHLRKAPKKNLYWVYNKNTGQKYSKEPLPKERAEAQRKALYANEKMNIKSGGRKIPDEAIPEYINMIIENEGIYENPYDFLLNLIYRGRIDREDAELILKQFAFHRRNPAIYSRKMKKGSGFISDFAKYTYYRNEDMLDDLIGDGSKK